VWLLYLSLKILEFTAIHEQPFPLLHYCGTSSLASVASAAQTNDLTVPPPPTTHARHKSSCSCFCWILTDHPSSCLGFWTSIWEVSNSTIMGKWKWLFMNGYECMSPIFTVTEFLNPCANGTDSSVCLWIVVKIVVFHWDDWATFKVVMTASNSMI
jgi:hypothetical protein